jgi:hypothetical protein
MAEVIQFVIATKSLYRSMRFRERPAYPEAEVPVEPVVFDFSWTSASSHGLRNLHRLGG